MKAVLNGEMERLAMHTVQFSNRMSRKLASEPDGGGRIFTKRVIIIYNVYTIQFSEMMFRRFCPLARPLPRCVKVNIH